MADSYFHDQCYNLYKKCYYFTNFTMNCINIHEDMSLSHGYYFHYVIFLHLPTRSYILITIEKPIRLPSIPPLHQIPPVKTPNHACTQPPKNPLFLIPPPHRKSRSRFPAGLIVHASPLLTLSLSSRDRDSRARSYSYDIGKQ